MINRNHPAPQLKHLPTVYGFATEHPLALSASSSANQSSVTETVALYTAFGDKRTLFRRALEHYVEEKLRDKMARLEANLSPAQAITGFFDEVIERSLSDKLQRGCMLVNSALEASPRDAEIQDTIARELKLIERFFKRCFVAGQTGGEIPATHSAEDAARHLLAVLLGLRVLARVRPERKLLMGAVRLALAELDLLPLAKEAGAPAPAAREKL